MGESHGVSEATILTEDPGAARKEGAVGNNTYPWREVKQPSQPLVYTPIQTHARGFLSAAAFSSAYC